MKKNTANMANEIVNATTLAPRNERERKNAKSTIGASDVRSIATNVVSPSTATTSTQMTRAEPQPHELLSTSASTSPVSPTVSEAMPGTSTWRVAVSSRDSCAANSVTATATAAI